jgi:hypothetical protein
MEIRQKVCNITLLVIVQQCTISEKEHRYVFSGHPVGVRITVSEHPVGI